MSEEQQMQEGNQSVWRWALITALFLVVVGGLAYYLLSVKPKTSNEQAAQPTADTTTTQPSVTNSQNTITLTSTGFSPATLTITAGQTVTWVNKSGQLAVLDSNPHPVHTDYPPLNLGSFANGASLSLTFPKPGTYGYHDHLNPSETGTIIVK